eukprot:TRINITY_DN24138_c0_g1_i1.p1 TRINITY_DN24138_c0_g1~~TRINITY_DN24138_c0_g1_i1.p1  ORF type:complete len:373 (+),score=86.25 TRINITY_DN24138_c0_g1_i1:46-1119(+)
MLRSLVGSEMCIRDRIPLAHVFINSPCCIRALSLKGNPVGSAGAKLLAEACIRGPINDQGAGFSCVETLTLRECGLGKRSAWFLSAILKSGRVGRLRTLDLGNNILGSYGKRLIEEAVEQRSLLPSQSALEYDVERNEVIPEVLNSLTHGFGVLFGIGAFPIMLSKSSSCSGTALLSILCYLVALITMFTSSTLYHSFYCLDTTMKVFRILDKSAIYFLIAGTYTPMLVLIFPDQPLYNTGLVLLLWVVTVIGVSIEALYHGSRKTCISLFLYITMGWSAIVVVYDIYNEMSTQGFVWLTAGGLAYTAGIPFFVIQSPEYMHVIWHCWVNLGAFLHFICIYAYVIPESDICLSLIHI